MSIDIAAVERFAPLSTPLPVAAMPSTQRIAEVREVLEAEFPWAANVIGDLSIELRTMALFGATELWLPPILLVGAPGCGNDLPPIAVPMIQQESGVLTLYPIQYRSEVETSDSFDIADAACRQHRRANSAGVAQSSAEWGRFSL